ncbi:hypothetical protein [Sphingomonas pituitosa]|uniref:hypothetical protein n=1 Tax=Sphingomonas pituitosa TaxID=99597 RepID=UPI00082F4479|nr:hypothetical protein [Sphingomonas pituitosa]
MLLPNTHVPGTRSAPMRMTAARYLELRRKAAGLSRYELAVRLNSLELAVRLSSFPSPAQRHRGIGAIASLIEQLERPGSRAKHPELVQALATIIPVDVAIYNQLANDPVDRHPTVCLSCGCSDYFPCTGAAGICTLERGTCTRCQSGAAQ